MSSLRKHKQIKSKTGVLSYQPKEMTRRNSFGDRYETHFTIWPLMGSLVESAHPFPPLRSGWVAAGVEAFLATQFSSTARGGRFWSQRAVEFGGQFDDAWRCFTCSNYIKLGFLRVVKQEERAVWKKSSLVQFFGSVSMTGTSSLYWNDEQLRSKM